MFVGWIYIWKNKVNGKVYVGQTRNKKGYKERWIQHKCAALNNYDLNDSYSWNGKGSRFHKAIREYGYNMFEKSILDEVKCENENNLMSKLDELEIKYIKEFDSYQNGYNSTVGGRASIFNCKDNNRKDKLILDQRSTIAYNKIQNAIKVPIRSNGKAFIIAKNREEYYDLLDIKLHMKYKYKYKNLRPDPLYTKSDHLGNSDYIMHKRLESVNDVLSFDSDDIEYIENHIENWVPNHIRESYDVYGDIYGCDEKMLNELLKMNDCCDVGSDLHCMIMDKDYLVDNTEFTKRQSEVLNLSKMDLLVCEAADELDMISSCFTTNKKTVLKRIMNTHEKQYKNSIRLNFVKGEYLKCNVCGEIKDESEFHSQGVNRKRTKCKKCRKNDYKNKLGAA